MVKQNSPIGVLDSGIGGFSVARQVQRLLPGEDILYFGDGAHVPYGNHPEKTIVALSRYMFEFMERHQVKVLLVGCNTISCVIDQCMDLVSCPVFNAVQAGVAGAMGRKEGKVGVISTVFTHNCQTYPRQLLSQSGGELEVCSLGCPNLASLVEHNLGNDAGMAQVEEELRRELGALVEREHIRCCLLGCTHYSLVSDSIQKLFPQLSLVDPAQEMALMLRQYLKEENLLRENKDTGKVFIYTTGDVAEYGLRAQQVGLKHVEQVTAYPALKI